MPPEYDSMFAKLVALGRTRGEALDTLTRALAESSIVLEGGVTNRTFLLHLLGDSDIRRGGVDIDWLDRLAAEGLHVSRQHADVAIVLAAIEACDVAFEAERNEFLASAARQRPVVRTEVGRTFELRYGGHRYVAEVLRQGPAHYRVMIDGTRIDAVLDRTGHAERLLTYGGRRYRTQSIVQGLTHFIEVGDALHRVSRDEAGILRAFSPSVVVAVHAKPGDHVEAGDTLLVLEAMKMETPILAPARGTVRNVWVLPNAQVGAGTALVRVDQDVAADGQMPTTRIAFRASTAASSPAGASGGWRSRARAVMAGLRAFAEALAPPDVERARNLLADLRELMLGSDIPPADVKRLVEEYRGLGDRLPAEDPVILRLEESILRIYRDISSLFGRQEGGGDPNEPITLSSGQYFLTYLRTLEARGAGLPATFVTELRRALTHFGSDSLDVNPALKNRVFWMYRSHLRAAEQAVVAQAVLERRARRAADMAHLAPGDFADLLEEIAALADDGAPTLADVARDVHYRYFLQPIFERGRQAVYDDLERHLAAITRDPETSERETHVRELVECPLPLGQFLAARLDDGMPAVRDTVLEVLTRRYYRIRPLNWVELGRLEGRSVLTAEYEHEGRLLRLIVTHASLEGLPSALASLRDIMALVPADRDLMLDLFVSDAPADEDPDTRSEQLRRVFEQAGFPRPLRRAVVALMGAGPEFRVSHPSRFTFRWTDGIPVEDRLYRGLHPMTAKRLEIERLSQFTIARLPSAEDVYCSTRSRATTRATNACSPSARCAI